MSYSIAAAPGAAAGRGSGPGASWENGPGGRLRVTPGRVAALALGVPIALAMIGWTSFNIVALLGQSNYPVNVTIQPYRNQLTVEVDASVTLRRNQASDARLTGSFHYSLFKPALNLKQTATDTSVGFHSCYIPVGDCGLDASLLVPEGVDVSLSSGGGDITVPAFSGNATLDTQGGNLSAGSLTGHLRLLTGGGDVYASSLDESDSNTLQVNSSGGNVDATGVVAANSSFQSGGGDITLMFTKAPTQLTINSEGGNVQLELPRGHYSISTTSDGGTISGATSTPGDTGSSITITSGGGDVSISGAY